MFAVMAHALEGQRGQNVAKADEIHSKMAKIGPLGCSKAQKQCTDNYFRPNGAFFQNFARKLKFRTVCCRIALLGAVAGPGGAESVEGPRDPSRNDIIGPERGPATKNNIRKTKFCNFGANCKYFFLKKYPKSHLWQLWHNFTIFFWTPFDPSGLPVSLENTSRR